MQTTVLSVGSVTYAMKAVRILRRIGIQAKTVKLDTNKTAKGCTHGIELATRDVFRAVKELQQQQIPYERYPFL
ncbi:MAG: DUF3343 domain-containing protein [Clostridia bacterium]|nr:DUF3343 domain-containing protein [Clostridia bacterium]